MLHCELTETQRGSCHDTVALLSKVPLAGDGGYTLEGIKRSVTPLS